MYKIRIELYKLTKDGENKNEEKKKLVVSLEVVDKLIKESKTNIDMRHILGDILVDTLVDTYFKKYKKI